MDKKLHMHPAQRRIYEQRVLTHTTKCSECGEEKMERYTVYPLGMPKSTRQYFKCKGCGFEIRDV